MTKNQKTKLSPAAPSIHSYNNLLAAISHRIKTSRYFAARAVNKEALRLYYYTGEMIAKQAQKQAWGSKIIPTLSSDIQKQFPGIRGFSERNIKNMRRFYEHYKTTVFGQLMTAQSSNAPIGQLPTAQSGTPTPEMIECFFSVGFTSHVLLMQKCKKGEEWLFYLMMAAKNQWSVDLLLHHLSTELYKNKGSLQSNFEKVVSPHIRPDALKAFRDDYVFPFIWVDDPHNEAQVENAIVANVKQFMMSLGQEFAFMGNQYRLVVDDEEYFVDLLFYHRGLRAMIAVELKTGKFKPEYAGKMNFYLAALDQLVKRPDENSSIGIILCREKKKTTVEFAFKFTTAAIGVATYKLASKPPKKLAKFLPKLKQLQEIVANTPENNQS